MQKILDADSGSIEYIDLFLESGSHEIERRTLTERIAQLLCDDLELARMSMHPEIELPWEFSDQIHEPLLIFDIFSWDSLARLLDLVREMDDTCSDISDILYSYFRISIVDIHIWEDGWVHVHESSFSLGYIRLRKKKHEQKHPNKYDKKENHKREISRRNHRRSMSHHHRHNSNEMMNLSYDFVMTSLYLAWTLQDD